MFPIRGAVRIISFLRAPSLLTPPTCPLPKHWVVAPMIGSFHDRFPSDLTFWRPQTLSLCIPARKAASPIPTPDNLLKIHKRAFISPTAKPNH